MKENEYTKEEQEKKAAAQAVIDEYDDEDDEYEEIDEGSNSTLSKDQLTKVMFIAIGAVVVVFLIIIMVLALANRSYSYEDIETIMAQAAESYFNKHPESLPQGNSSVEISAAELSNAGEMKPLEKYLPEGVVCSGSVNVQKSAGGYLYTPKLDCGEKYATIELYRKILEDNKTVSSGYGLYNKAGNRVFRGEVVNNYLQLDKTIWRILRITSSGEMVIITEGYEANSLAWDDRYNQTVEYQSGINNYSTSRIKESLLHLYSLPEDSEEAEIFLSDADKTKLVSFDLFTGKRGADEVGSDNTVERAQLTKGQMIGLATVSDYMAASTDINCQTAASDSCQNYNYLVNGEEWWTVTAIKENTYQAYTVDTDGDIEVKNVNNYANLRPVVHLSERVLFKGGDGSINNPYTIK